MFLLTSLSVSFLSNVNSCAFSPGKENRIAGTRPTCAAEVARVTVIKRTTAGTKVNKEPRSYYTFLYCLTACLPALLLGSATIVFTSAVRHIYSYGLLTFRTY